MYKDIKKMKKYFRDVIFSEIKSTKCIQLKISECKTEKISGFFKINLLRNMEGSHIRLYNKSVFKI